MTYESTKLLQYRLLTQLPHNLNLLRGLYFRFEDGNDIKFTFRPITKTEFMHICIYSGYLEDHQFVHVYIAIKLPR